MGTSHDWWRETVVYQIYPRSFADSNGDGIGDLAGIESHLDYLADLGVGTIWFSPFYESPQRDVGYDISNYRGIAPEYGNMAAAQKLIDAVHARGMRVVFDMVMNHTSDQHPWFVESRKSRDNPKRDWYVWRDGRGPRKPPNNWHAMIGGSGWHYDETTDQWYWTQFLPFQPDINYRNPEVRAEMLDTLRFWLDRGVDGFRLDIVNALFEDPEFRDNPFTFKVLPSDDDPSMLFQTSENTLNHPDTLAFMKELRAVMDSYDNPARFLVGEVNAPIGRVLAHCGENADGLNLVFLFRSLTAKLKAPVIRELVSTYDTLFKDPLLPTWVFGNHDRARRIFRLGDDVAKAKLNMAWQLTARGVPFIYYGDEIGMTQVPMKARDSRDALVHKMSYIPQFVHDAVRAIAKESINRDECRTPMQWNSAKNVGFCPDDIPAWLPPPTATRGRTVADQEGDPASLLSCYKRFLTVRKVNPALRRGDSCVLSEEATGKTVAGYVREADGQKVVVLLNAGGNAVTIRNPDPGATLLVSTDVGRGQVSGPEINLGPWEGLVLSR